MFSGKCRKSKTPTRGRVGKNLSTANGIGKSAANDDNETPAECIGSEMDWESVTMDDSDYFGQTLSMTDIAYIIDTNVFLGSLALIEDALGKGQ